MNLDLQGFLDYYKRKNAFGIMVTEKGYSLSDKEAKEYAKWGIKNGYAKLYEMPEFEEVKDQLKLKDL